MTNSIHKWTFENSIVKSNNIDQVIGKIVVWVTYLIILVGFS